MKKLMLAMMTVAAASVFGSFSYQGALKLADGTAVTELNKTITFRLYTNPSDDNAIWAGQASVLLASGTGIFNTEISDSLQAPSDFQGTRQPLDTVLAANANETLYLGLTVAGSNGEIRPRQKLLAVPTASFAHNVKKAAADFTVEGNLRVNGKIMSGSGNTEVMPVPVGGIIMWSKIDAPDGEAWATSSNTGHWAICNGQGAINGQTIPDLRGRFIVGVNDTTTGRNELWKLYSLGNAGGEENHLLTAAEMPVHSHLYRQDRSLAQEWLNGSTPVWNVNPGGYVSSGGNGFEGDGNGSNGKLARTGTAGGNSTDKVVGTSSDAHNNLPPYYALYYIMRVR